jgi:hypothetical protein
MILHRPFHRFSIKCCFSHREDPIVQKINNVDKLTCDKKRQIYDDFMYTPYEYLTTYEMKQISKKHLLSLCCKKNRLYLQLSPNTSENEDYWEPITDILNDLFLMNFIREELNPIPEPLDAPLLVPLPIEYINPSNTVTKYTDWIDFCDSVTVSLEEPDII